MLYQFYKELWVTHCLTHNANLYILVMGNDRRLNKDKNFKIVRLFNSIRALFLTVFKSLSQLSMTQREHLQKYIRRPK